MGKGVWSLYFLVSRCEGRDYICSHKEIFIVLYFAVFDLYMIFLYK